MESGKWKGNKRVPELRFPEFEGEWEERKLGEMGEIYSGGTPRSTEKSYYEPKEIPWITSTELNKKKIDHVNNYISKKGFSNSSAKMVRKGTLLLALYGATAGVVGITYIDASINQAVLAIELRNDSNYYIYTLLNRNRKKIILKYTQGGQPNLSGNLVKSITINIPSLSEQQKIGDFFYKIDKKLELQQQRIEALKEYKKGMMQKIFSQEIRFKDDNGKDYPEWEEKRLGEVSKNYGGKPLEKYVHGDADFKFISIGNYSKDGKYVDNGQRIILNEKTKEKLLNKDDIAIVLNDKTKTGDIIGSSILINTNNEYIYNQRTQRVVFDKNVFNIHFIWLQLNWTRFRKEIFRRSQGGTQIYINFSEVEKIPLSIPSLPEQTKIANFLSSLDKKIELEEEKLENFKQFKKGLMQKMFI